MERGKKAFKMTDEQFKRIIGLSARQNRLSRNAAYPASRK
jgi:hypothetical protein